MKVPFWKITATGNDFILIDNFTEEFGHIKDRVAKLCTRRKGIGADGMLFLQQAKEGKDFCMEYFNPDGQKAEMCGNGARAISYFYHQMRGGGGHYAFETQNGAYFSQVQGNLIRVRMTELREQGTIDISRLVETKFSYYIDTGVPHCVYEVENLDQYDVLGKGRIVRHDNLFAHGANCNFLRWWGNRFIFEPLRGGSKERLWPVGRASSPSSAPCI